MRINNGYARAYRPSRGLPADFGDGGAPDRLSGAQEDERQGLAGEGVAWTRGRLNYCTCGPLNHKNNKLRAALYRRVASTCIYTYTRARTRARHPLSGGIYTDAERPAPALSEPIEI